ncbi:MAG TPA: histidine phosphatase family protein [Anaerolineales bacterium]|nr:histidine phosphatase family protein [Anaerolineales bacterium]
MGTRILYLVRHGQARPGEPLDDLGNGLSALGKRQARWAARRLMDLPVSAIYHSPLRRAAETAAVISEHLPKVPVRVSPLLRECVPGWPIHVRHYYQKVPRTQIEQERKRAEQALAKFFRPTRGPNRREILVAHGNIIRYLVLSVLGHPPKMWTNIDFHNAALSEVHIFPTGERILLRLGDNSHIPQRWLTFL